MTEFPIYVLGDADSYFHIFNSIAMLLQDNFAATATSLALMVLMIRVGIAFTKANIQGGAGGVFLGVGIFAAALYPTTTAHIIDVREQGQVQTYTKIDNLPFALVFIAYGASSVTVGLADIMDDAFSVVGTNQASAIGIGRQPELMQSILKISNFDTQEDDFSMSYYKKAFKIYVKECAMATSYIPPSGLDYFVKAPKNLLEHISPTTLGIPDTAYASTTFDDGVVTLNKCNEMYQYMIDKQTSITDKMIDKLKKANSDLNWDSYEEEIATGVFNAGMRTAKIEDLGTYSNALRVSMLNYALSNAMEQSISNYKYDIPSVGDLANYSVEKSMASMMVDGIGMIAWINKIAPLVIHYSLLFSYGLFLLMIPVALGMGYENATKIISNYAMGIIAIHIGYVAAVIANSINLYYTNEGATEKILSIGNNMTAVTAIPHLNQYASEMAGISGVLLIMAYTVGSAIIFKGETAAMNGALGTIAGRFKNEMLEASQDMAKKSSYDEFQEKQRRDAQKFIKENNFAPAPADVSDVQYVNDLKRGLEEIGGGYGFMHSQNAGGSGFNGNYIGGTANKSSQMATSTETFGANTTSTDAINSGAVMGVQSAGQAKGMSQALDQHGSDKIMDTSRLGTLSGLKDQINAMNVLSNRFGDNLKGKQRGMAYDQMATNEADMKLAGRVGNAKGYKDIDNAYNKTVDNAEYGVKSKTASTQAKILAQGGIDSAADYDARDSKIKAAQQMGSIEGTEKAIKDAGKDLVDGLKSLAKEMSQGKFASDMETIDRANEKYKDGGYVGLQKDAATVKADQLIGNTSGLLNLTDAQKEGTINDIRAKAYGESEARGKAVDSDLKKAGLLGENGDVNTDNWVSGKSFLQANNMNSHNAIVAGGAVFSGAMGADGTSSIQMNALSSTSTGSKDEHNNNVTKLNNTDPLTTLAMARFDGDKQKASNWARSADGAKWMMDPRNELSVVAAEAGYQINDKLLSGMSDESAAFATSAIIGGGIGLAAINKMTGGAISDGVKKAWNSTKTENSMPDKTADISTTEQDYDPKNHTTNHSDSLKSYTNAEAHNSNIIPKSDVNYKQFAGEMLEKGGKVLGFLDVFNSAAGGVMNTMTAIGDAGANYYKTGEFDGGQIAASAASIFTNPLNSAIDGVNTMVSAATAGALYVTGNGNGGLINTFNTQFDNNAQSYSGLTARTSSTMFENMTGDVRQASVHPNWATQTLGQNTMHAIAVDNATHSQIEATRTDNETNARTSAVGQNEMIDQLASLNKNLEKSNKGDL